MNRITTIANRDDRPDHGLSRHAGLYLAAIVFLFIAQQAVGLHLRWVDDETWYLLPAQNLLSEGRFRIPVFAGRDREFAVVFPLLSALQAGSWLIHDMGIVQARLLTLSFGVGVILCTYLLGRRLVDDRFGLLAALLCAIDNMIFLAGRTVRPEILVCFFTLVALWLVLKSLQDERWWPLVIAGCAIGAGMSAHPNGIAAPLCGVALLLSRQGWNFLRKPHFYLLTISSVLAFLPFVAFYAWNEASRGFEGLQYLQRVHSGNSDSFLQVLVSSASKEFWERYWAFVAFPFRVHIAVLTLAAVVVGLIYDNKSSRFLAVCVLIHVVLFWAVIKANKSPRYLTLIAPFVAMIWAGWIAALWSRWRDAPTTSGLRSKGFAMAAIVALAVLLGPGQIAGNLGYVWKFRRADTAEVCRQVDALVEPGSTIYGTMTFWINLRHHTYVPYMRMPWKQAVLEYKPNVVILDDWVMVHGSYPGEWDELRAELHEYVGQHGRLLGEIHSSFYGDLKIYEVKHDG